mgnify:FL=1
MNRTHIYFGAASKTDADAIKILAKAFQCSEAQIVRLAMSEWLSDNFIKKLEFASALQEVKEVQDDSGQT